MTIQRIYIIFPAIGIELKPCDVVSKQTTDYTMATPTIKLLAWNSQCNTLYIGKWQKKNGGKEHTEQTPTRALVYKISQLKVNQ